MKITHRIMSIALAFVMCTGLICTVNANENNGEMYFNFTKESKDNYYVSFGKRMNVERGTYYRVQSEHFVFKGDDFEETYCFTDGIMID